MELTLISNEVGSNSADEVITDDADEFDWISKTFYKGSLEVYDDSADESMSEAEGVQVLPHTKGGGALADDEGDVGRRTVLGCVGICQDDEGESVMIGGRPGGEVDECRGAVTGGEGNDGRRVITGDVVEGGGDKEGSAETEGVAMGTRGECRGAVTGGEGNDGRRVITGDVVVGGTDNEGNAETGGVVAGEGGEGTPRNGDKGISNGRCDVSDGGDEKYGEISVTELNKIDGIRWDLMKKIEKQSHYIFIAPSKLSGKDGDLGAYAASSINVLHQLVEYVDIIHDANYNENEVLTDNGSQAYYIACKRTGRFFNGFDRRYNCCAYFLGYANDPLGKQEPNLYLGYDDNGRMGLFNSAMIKPMDEYCWEYDDTGEYWKARKRFLDDGVWKNVLRMYPELMKKKRTRVVMDDEDEDDLNSQGVSSTPTKRRRLQRTSTVVSEATYPPLFSRSSATNQAILQCQLIANVREMRIGVELLRDAFCAAATGKLLITKRSRKDVYCIIRQLVSTYSSITSATCFQSLPASDFLTKMLDEVRKMYTESEELYLSVRETQEYTDFGNCEVIKDEYNLTLTDITKTITRLWNEMTRLSWNNLAAVDNRNIGIWFYFI